MIRLAGAQVAADAQGQDDEAQLQASGCSRSKLHGISRRSSLTDQGVDEQRVSAVRMPELRSAANTAIGVERCC
jgi:hypothetical protein